MSVPEAAADASPGLARHRLLNQQPNRLVRYRHANRRALIKWASVSSMRPGPDRAASHPSVPSPVRSGPLRRRAAPRPGKSITRTRCRRRRSLGCDSSSRGSERNRNRGKRDANFGSAAGNGRQSRTRHGHRRPNSSIARGALSKGDRSALSTRTRRSFADLRSRPPERLVDKRSPVRHRPQDMTPNRSMPVTTSTSFAVGGSFAIRSRRVTRLEFSGLMLTDCVRLLRPFVGTKSATSRRTRFPIELPVT